MSERKRPTPGEGAPVPKRPKLEVAQEPLQNEEEFKKRKIEEWKAKVGHQSGGIDFLTLKRKIAEQKEKVLMEKGLLPAKVLGQAGDGAAPSSEADQASAAAPQQQATLDIVRPPSERDNPYFDHRIGAAHVKGKRKANFKFVSQGKYVQKADKMRTEARLEALKNTVMESMKKAGVVDPSTQLISDAATRRDAPPLVEWWDLPLTHGYKTYDDLLGDDEERMLDFSDPVPMAVESDATRAGRTAAATEMMPPITMYVQHPVPIPPKFEGPPPPRKVMYTKKEQKKVRRQRRMEEQRERQDKIRLGLLPPEEPKVRMANLARVLRNESVADPTKVSSQVMQQVEARRLKHEKVNLERQLTPEQRREKKEKQKLKDEGKGLHVAVFKCRDMSNPKVKFKINANAQQLGLTGVAIMHGDLHVVVVEGGGRGIRHFKKLLLRRINWKSLASSNADDPETLGGADLNDDESDDDDLTGDPTHQHCWVLWEGQAAHRSFQGFRFKRCVVDKQAADLFATSGVSHYWDLAKTWVPPRLT